MTCRLTIIAALTLAVAMSSTAAAQRGHHGSSGGGRPATTGLEHAETKANPHGERGIENAEAKQAAHKHKHKKHSHKHSR
jgi:hypothetical protein